MEANGDGILERPFTRFLVMTDAENKYTTAEQRRGQRKILLDAIAKTLPPLLRPELYLPEARTVEIVHWGTGRPFEFAHFTDRQLARALLTLAPKPHPKGEDALIRAIHAQRTRDPSPNIESFGKLPG